MSNDFIGRKKKIVVARESIFVKRNLKRSADWGNWCRIDEVSLWVLNLFKSSEKQMADIRKENNSTSIG